MIRINLLPVRAARKKESVRQQLSIAGLMAVLVLVVVMAAYLVLLGNISGTKNEISRSEQELAQLKVKIGQIDNIKKLEDEVKKKLEVLNQLRQAKTGPVNRLTTLSDIIPEKMWLTRYSENGADVNISGYAINEDLIADFIRSLEKSPDFIGVELQVTEQTEVSGMKLKRFDLTCKVRSMKKEEPAPQPQKK